MLKLAGLRAVVVGAGKIGLRKVQALREAGAKIRLISGPCAPPEDIPADVEIVPESYKSQHLVEAKLVFACTDDRTVNAQIAADARKIGIFVNAADQPGDCDFYMPATIHDGDVVVAIGTGGSAPALSGEIKKQLLAGNPIPGCIGEFASLLAEIRDEFNLTDLPIERRSSILRELAKPGAYEIFISSGTQALRDYAEKLLQESTGNCL